MPWLVPHGSRPDVAIIILGAKAMTDYPYSVILKGAKNS